MRTLYLGLSGDDVRAWQNYLVGSGYVLVAAGGFDNATKAATAVFQQKNGLSADGSVGPNTMGFAMQHGFNPLSNDSVADTGPNWPSKPMNVSNMPDALRASTFGTFKYVADPQPGNAEHIKITDGWDTQNIVHVNIPQLVGVHGAPTSGNIACHKLVAKQLQSVFKAWEDAGLIDRILTFDGSWVPRFKRGSTTSLSNHAWGTAFDMNAQWNPLGSQPALKGTKGCMRELAEVAVEHGWWMGLWFSPPRQDGMHIEAFKVVT